ncbi:MAG: hypothetical protein FJ290_07125 [Planctomycetes bacterium]|nr:hypothetical protein [Planctomycetota bacterium]
MGLPWTERGWRARLRRVTPAIACLLAVGCCGLRRASAPSGPHFSVLTYNVNNWALASAAETLTAIRAAGADIVCLQETNPSWERLFRAEFREAYPHMGFRHARGAGGLGVMSRWPVEDVEHIPPTVGWFPAWLLRAETPLGQVQFLDVHLRPAMNDRGHVGVGPYFSTRAVRRKEIEALFAHARPRLPTVVLGDLNEGDLSPAVRWLRGKGLVNALREFDRTTSTWHHRSGLLRIAWRLDHILYSKELHCVGARVIRAGGSDHYPVLATFQGAQGG